MKEKIEERIRILENSIEGLLAKGDSLTKAMQKIRESLIEIENAIISRKGAVSELSMLIQNKEKNNSLAKEKKEFKKENTRKSEKEEMKEKK